MAGNSGGAQALKAVLEHGTTLRQRGFNLTDIVEMAILAGLRR
jgi:hypothetical protein